MPETESQAANTALASTTRRGAPPVALVPRYAWHLAFLMIEQFGMDAAAPYAAERCAEMAAEGDEEDRRVWGFTLAALEELRRTMRTLHEALH